MRSEVELSTYSVLSVLTIFQNLEYLGFEPIFLTLFRHHFLPQKPVFVFASSHVLRFH